MTTENAHVAKEMTKRRGLVFALTIEFILGVILTTLLNYDPAKHSFAQNAVLIVHILIGLGITIGGVLRLIWSVKSHSLTVASVIGLLTSLGALGSGDEARRTGNDTAVFIMSMCFIVGLLAYGYSYIVLQREAAKT